MGELLNLWGAPVCFSVKYEYSVSSIRDDENLKPGSERDYENMKAGSGKGLTTVFLQMAAMTVLGTLIRLGLTASDFYTLCIHEH